MTMHNHAHVNSKMQVHVPVTQLRYSHQSRSTHFRINKELLMQSITIVAMVVNGLLFLRFVFTAASLDGSDQLIGIIYRGTYSLVKPFFDLFNAHIHSGSGHIEFETIMAIIVYSLIARALIRLVEQSSQLQEVE